MHGGFVLFSGVRRVLAIVFPICESETDHNNFTLLCFRCVLDASRLCKVIDDLEPWN
jgi:hypothetical protein